MRLSRTITAPTARRGQVERVATSCDMRMKYSSQEGRTFFRVSWAFEVSTAVSLKGSIEPVSRVTETGDDKGAVVQFGVDGCGVERHVGVLFRQAFHAWHGGDGVKAGDPGRALFLEFVYGGGETPPRREHWVEYEDQVLVEVAWKVDVILDRLGRLLIALEAHKAHSRRRQQRERPVEHPQSGAQHGDQADGIGNLLHLSLRNGGANAGLARWHVPRGFGDQNQGKLLHGLPEVGGPGALVAQDGELVATQGAVYDVEVIHVGGGLTHRAGMPL